MDNWKRLTNYNKADYTPKVGTVVTLDCWGGWPVQLSESDWNKAAFRIPLRGNGPITSLAVNVELTGHTAQVLSGVNGLWVRANIVFVGDCEPDQTVKGWVRFNQNY